MDGGKSRYPLHPHTPPFAALKLPMHLLIIRTRSQLLSRHESALSSHLDMLNSIRDHVKDDEAVRTLSGMVETTNRLMLQFKVVKKQVGYELCLALESVADVFCR